MKYAFAFLLLLGIGFAQQVSVDGSKNPELIPDSAAIQAIFAVHSNFNDAATIDNTEKQHAKIGFSAADHAIYDAAMQAHLNAKKQKFGEIYGDLMRTLSPEGRAKVRDYIQSEKRHMHYDRQQPIPQEANQ